MTQTTAAHPKQRELRNVKILLVLAIVSALVAAVAGLVFLIVSPEKDSTAGGALGITAALAGLATAGFTIAAAIYAQIKNLWQYAPIWVRVLAWALIAFAVITTVWNWIA